MRIYILGLFLLLLQNADALPSETNIGFYIIPRNNVKHGLPYVMNISSSGEWFFAEFGNREDQIFILKKPSARKLCLKYKEDVCLDINADIDRKKVTLFRWKVCQQSLEHNKINILRTVYENIFTINIKRCNIYCLYSHSKEAAPGDDPSPTIKMCDNSNINTHYYMVEEEGGLDTYYRMSGHNYVTQAPGAASIISPNYNRRISGSIEEGITRRSTPFSFSPSYTRITSSVMPNIMSRTNGYMYSM
ncbi:hypothetical protein NEAUS06_1643 [Nematocida ausubeli]|nr:hypothetical protein NEAUS06_1643 [Nematocida ausubeli]